MNNNLEDKLKDLRKAYIGKLKATFLEFNKSLNEELINIEDIYLKVHTISGTSGMYGLKEISDTSTEFEFYLKSLRENENIIDCSELKDEFLNYLNSIEKILLKGE